MDCSVATAPDPVATPGLVRDQDAIADPASMMGVAIPPTVATCSPALRMAGSSQLADTEGHEYGQRDRGNEFEKGSQPDRPAVPGHEGRGYRRIMGYLEGDPQVRSASDHQSGVDEGKREKKKPGTALKKHRIFSLNGFHFSGGCVPRRSAA
jgi:hypothetical protein